MAISWARQRKINFGIFFFGFGLLFLPIISSAQIIPTGPKCNPDILPVMPTKLTYGTCTTSPEVGGNILHLKWDLQGTYQSPDCSIHCNNEFSNQIIYPCRSFNPNVTGSFVNDIRVLNYTYDIAKRNGQNFLSATATQQNLKPKDDIYIRNSQPGDDYKITCQEKGKTGTEAKVKTSVLAKVVQGKGSGGGEPCEVPFDTIINKLNSYQPTVITERSFQGWSFDDRKELDKASKGGSGTLGDLRDYISSRQCELIDNWQIVQTAGNSSFRPEEIKRWFNQFNKEKDAAPFDVYYYYASSTAPAEKYHPAGYTFAGAHALIFLDWINPGLSGVADKIKFTFLNPNGPAKETADCSPRDVGILERVLLGSDKFYFCLVPESGDGLLLRAPSTMPGARPNPLIGLTEKLKNNPVRKETAVFLSDMKNVPNINNPSSNLSPKGSCGGWRDFVLSVAYLGNFSEDYHPNDSNVVNFSCDANHYPISKTSQTKLNRSWLANLWSVGGIFSNLTR